MIPTWNAAFVYDTEADAQAPLELLEYANSQLLQFRAYDGLLDRQLARIYAAAPGAPLVRDASAAAMPVPPASSTRSSST